MPSFHDAHFDFSRYIDCYLKGMDVRNGRSILIISILTMLSILSCRDNQPFQPTEPVDKLVRGTITDDTGNPLQNVSVALYQSGSSIGTHPSDATAVTDEDGIWEATVTINVTSRVYTIFISQNGYIDVMSSVAVFYEAADTIHSGTIALPESEFDDVYRITVTWGANPPDLDAHLTGPDGTNGRFRLYWANQRVETAEGEPHARLIADRRTGYGPETVAISALQSGTYRFSVHNYNANGVAGDSLLVLTSGATVRIFSDSGIEHEYTITADDFPSGAAGNLWRVFEIDGTTGDIEFINQLYDGVPFDDDVQFKMQAHREKTTIR
jgi:hypothetical protein